MPPDKLALSAKKEVGSQLLSMIQQAIQLFVCIFSSHSAYRAIPPSIPHRDRHSPYLIPSQGKTKKALIKKAVNLEHDESKKAKINGIFEVVTKREVLKTVQPALERNIMILWYIK